MSGVDFLSKGVLEAAHASEASRLAGRVLVVGSSDWAQWVRREFAPTELFEMASFPDAGSVATPGADQSYDLVVVAEGLEFGSLAEAQQRLGQLRSLLAKDGRGLFVVRPMGHPLRVDDGPTPVGSFDALLFPHAAKMGDLGRTAQDRLMLSPLSWRYMLERAGFSVIEASGGELDGQATDLRQVHESRLAHFDDEALSSSAVTFLVSADGGSQ